MLKQKIVFMAAIGLVFVAIWWLWFLVWQLGFVRFIQDLSFKFEPSALSSDAVVLATKRAFDRAIQGGLQTADIFFSQNEISHLNDVAILYKTTRVALGLLALGSLVILIISLHSHPKILAPAFILARNILLILCAVMMVALIFFSSFFVFFHKILFPMGNWTFSSQTMLIQIFPETFWKLMLGWFVLGGLLFSALYHVVAHQQSHE